MVSFNIIISSLQILKYFCIRIPRGKILVTNFGYSAFFYGVNLKKINHYVFLISGIIAKLHKCLDYIFNKHETNWTHHSFVNSEKITIYVNFRWSKFFTFPKAVAGQMEQAVFLKPVDMPHSMAQSLTVKNTL